MSGAESIPESQIEKHRPEDGLDSTWYAMHYAHKFAEIDKSGNYVYTEAALEVMQHQWANQLQNSLRSDRQKDEIEKILELIDFELRYRHADFDKEFEALGHE